MMVSICVEAVIILLFVILKVLINHWFLALILIGLGVAIKGFLGNILIGGLSALSQFVSDLMSIGILGAFIAPLCGLAWVILAVRSDAPWYVKYPAIIPVMIIGTGLEILPIFGIPTAIFAFLMSDDFIGGMSTATLIILATPFYLALFGIPGLTDILCWIANTGMKLF